MGPVCYQPINLVQSTPLVVQHSIPLHVGSTAAEVNAKNNASAKALKMNQPQEMKPSDNDPYRMYPVRELDWTFTTRNRMTIDSGDIGPCRWYQSDGKFYAVRQPN